MLSAKGITLTRGGHVVLDDVSLSIGPRTRMGVVGPNGIGKSTLLQVLAGALQPDSGTIDRVPVELSVGYLSQELEAEPGETLLGYLGRRTGVAAAEADLDRLTTALADQPEALEEYSAALDHFVALGGDGFEARAAERVVEVGLPVDRLALGVDNLSGGESARARLAAILLSRFDVVLLDEPTNDLDFEGLSILEDFLARAPVGVVTVSHDRAFLDRAVDRILEVEEHTHRAREYAGAWSDYVERRALGRAQASASYQAWSSRRRALGERIRAQRAWSEEGVRRAARKPADHDRAQQGFRVNRTEKQAAKVRISERALERLGTLDKPWEGWELHLDLAPAGRSGDVVARLDGAVLQRGSFTLGPVDLQLDWAERVVVTGPNGGGKSTLLAAILGRHPLVAGRRRIGPSVRFGEMDQARAGLGGGTLLESFTAATGLLAEESRSNLAKFGLGAAHVGRLVAGLSPGERTRAQLAALMAMGTNCLVLDEPTNHLDLPAIEGLEEALEGFAGTLVVVTHDRWLLETLRVDRMVTVRAGQVAEGAG